MAKQHDSGIASRAVAGVGIDAQTEDGLQISQASDLGIGSCTHGVGVRESVRAGRRAEIRDRRRSWGKPETICCSTWSAIDGKGMLPPPGELMPKVELVLEMMAMNSVQPPKTKIEQATTHFNSSILFILISPLKSG